MRIGLHERHTTVSTFILGLTSFTYIYSFHQASVQRITSQRSLRSAKGVMYANLVGTSLTGTILFLGGIGIYAVYHGCDPLTLGLIQKRDQITPFYVIQHLVFLPGVPGLFVACLFSATLSTISSILNIIPTMLWNDFLVELQYFRRTSERKKIIFIKLLTMSLGLGMIALAFLASKTKGVFQAALTVASLVSGPFAGVFVMGIAVPIVGKKGAIAGLITSVSFMSWICMGAQLYGKPTPMLPLQTHLCQNSSAIMTTKVTTDISSSMGEVPGEHHPLLFLYNISYAYFCTIGMLVCITVALAVTFATGCEKLSNVKPDHVIHCLRRWVGPRDSGTSAEMESILKDAHNFNKLELHKKCCPTHKTTDTNVTNA